MQFQPNLTKFGQAFYNNREPVGVNITEIENLDAKTNDELDVLGRRYCQRIAELAPDAAGAFLNGHTVTTVDTATRTSTKTKYNGFICRFYNDTFKNGLVIQDTNISYSRYAQHYTCDYIAAHQNNPSKKEIVAQLHKIVKLFEHAQDNPELLESFKIAIQIAQEFECLPGAKEKLSAAIRGMEAKTLSAIEALFYNFKDNIINQVAGSLAGDSGQSTHNIAGARYQLRDTYGITANEKGWDSIARNVANALQTRFGDDTLVKAAIDHVTDEIVSRFGEMNYTDEQFYDLDGMTKKLIGNHDFRSNSLFTYDGTNYTKKVNFASILRHQVMQSAANRLEFIVDPMIKVLSMDNIGILIAVTAESYDERSGDRKYPAILIKEDFISMQDIIDSLVNGVTCEGRKNEIIAQLDLVKGELVNLAGVAQEFKNTITQQIDNGVLRLQGLTAEQLMQEAERRRVMQEAEQKRATMRNLHIGNLIQQYNGNRNNKNNFQNALWGQFQDVVNAEHENRLKTAAGKMFDALKRVNPRTAADLNVTAMDSLKAFVKLVLKCILTTGILPVIELIRGESIIAPSDRELKNRCVAEAGSFREFVLNPRVPAAIEGDIIL